MDPWYQRLWKSITSIFRIGGKETFTPVNMIECMDGKPLSDKSIQDCLFNNQPTLPEKPIEKNEESVKDSIDSAKEEHESVLETRVKPEEMSDTESESDLYSDSDSESDSESDSIPVLEFIPNTVDRLIEDMLQSRH
ncbi:hypothetical protein TNCV_4570241 [Trichonephila clavipes]|nr:hypothetical protein TNCV_4570241 [Trichonephila clavipes]